MLKPEELKLMQGFPKDYIIDRDYRWKSYPITKQVARIGNSVVPIMAQKLVGANCPYLKVGERLPNFRTEEEGSGQQIRREAAWEYLQRRCGLRGDADGDNEGIAPGIPE